MKVALNVYNRRIVVSALALAALAVTETGRSAGLEKPRVTPELPVTAMDQRSAFAHNSPLLVADPADDRVVLMAGRIDNPDFGCSLHVSGNGGRTWVPSTLPDLPKSADKCYGPEAAYDAEGNLKLLFVGLTGRGNSPMGAFLVDSSQRGYSKPRRVLGPERYMVRMAIDPTVGDKGRLHLVWLQAGADPPLGGLPQADNPIMAAHSDDGGRTFSKPVRISDPKRTRAVAPALAVGPSGDVHVAYYDLQEDFRDYQGLEGPAWEGNWSLVVSTSRNRGRSFSPGVVVDDGLVPPERVMLIFTMPPPAVAAGPGGKAFVAWHDARNGDWDVFLSRSANRGKTWSTAKRLNDDPLKNGRHQHLARLSVAPRGRVDAIFYDRRDDQANQKAGVFLASSVNGGRSFGPNHRITREPSDTMVGPRYPIPSATGLVEFGSRIALLSRENSALAAWTDTRNSFADSYQQEIYAAKINLGSGTR